MEARIVVIGLGLIGGSFALALRNAWPSVAITGIDRDDANLDEALRRGAIDAVGAIDDGAAVRDADVILLAVPVRQLPAVLAGLAPHLQANTVITDVGSTKQDVAAVARTALGERARQFVPAHPIAGREHSGMAAAATELFDDRTVVLTPLAENSADDVNRVKMLWQACGARAVEMTAATHDEIFAAVSHLPHMLAFALVDEFAARPNAKSLFSFAASGFRDFTRIASSSPEMWRDIALNNRTALVAEMDRYLRHAGELRDAIAAGDSVKINTLMQRAQQAREHWLAGELEHFRDESA